MERYVIYTTKLTGTLFFLQENEQQLLADSALESTTSKRQGDSAATYGS